MFHSSFAVSSPSRLFQLLDLWTKFSIEFDRAMREIDSIDDGDHLHVWAIRDDSYSLKRDYGFPLHIMVTVKNLQGHVTAHVDAIFYLNENTGQAIGWVGNVNHEPKDPGDIDTVVKEISDGMVNYFKAQSAFFSSVHIAR